MEHLKLRRTLKKWLILSFTIIISLAIINLMALMFFIDLKKPKINAGELTKMVMAFYHGWYGVPEGPSLEWQHWNHWVMNTSTNEIIKYHDPNTLLANSRRDIGAVHYPELGPYDVRDESLLRAHMDWANEAGIDVFVFDWFGPPDEYIDENIKIMLNYSERTDGILLSVLYNGYEYRNAPLHEVQDELDYIIRTYGTSEKYLKVEGYPVLFIYSAQHFRSNDWALVISNLRKSGLQFITLCDAIEEDYAKVFDGLYTYSPVGSLASSSDLNDFFSSIADLARRYGLIYSLTALPGYDDTAVRLPGLRVERNDGETYNETWKAILELDSRWALICSWNEWHEGTEIEPSLEYGRTYLALTKHFADEFKG